MMPIHHSFQPVQSSVNRCFFRIMLEFKSSIREVLRRLPERLREFVVTTSVLEVVSAARARALGIDDAPVHLCSCQPGRSCHET